MTSFINWRCKKWNDNNKRRKENWRPSKPWTQTSCNYTGCCNHTGSCNHTGCCNTPEPENLIACINNVMRDQVNRLWTNLPQHATASLNLDLTCNWLLNAMSFDLGIGEINQRFSSDGHTTSVMAMEIMLINSTRALFFAFHQFLDLTVVFRQASASFHYSD